MKSKQLLTLLIVAVVLAIVCTVVVRRRNQTWQGRADLPGRELLQDFAINDVASLVVTGPDSSVTITRKENRWVVPERFDYPANFDTLRTFLLDLDELRVAQDITVGESQFARLDLVAPGSDSTAGVGTLVAFHNEAGEPIARVIFGKEHEKQGEEPANPMMMGMGGGNWPDGRYLRLADSGDVVLVAKTFNAVEPDASRWIDKEFFKVTDMKEAWLTVDDEEAWRVSRENSSGNLTLAGEIPEGKEVDTTKLNSIKSAFGWASFSDIADPALSPEQTGMDTPKVYTVRTFDGFVYTIRIGAQTDAGTYYLQAAVAYDGPSSRDAAEDESPEEKEKAEAEFQQKQKDNRAKAETENARLQGWTYIVTKYTVESVIRSRDELLKDKPKPAETDAAGADKAGTGAVGTPSPPPGTVAE